MNTSSTSQINYLLLALLFSCQLLTAQISQGTGEALGPQSIASGTNSIASGEASLAVGSGAHASGEHSASIGLNTNASGNYAVAFGDGNQAIGEASFVTGRQNSAKSLAETVMGTYAEDYTPANSNSNQSWYGTDRLLTVANGTSDLDRSNALVVYKDGYTELDGKLEVSKSINVGQDDSGFEVPGDIRYNTSNADFEGFTGSEWKSFTNTMNTSNPISSGFTYLIIPDIPGSAQILGISQLIEILSWSWEITQSGTTHSGAGGGSGQATHQDISIVKYPDLSSIPLLQKVVTGDYIDYATLVIKNADGSLYMMIELEDIIVKKHSIAGSADAIPHTENIVLNFSVYTITYYEPGIDGEPGTEVSFSWDIAANVGN